MFFPERRPERRYRGVLRHVAHKILTPKTKVIQLLFLVFLNKAATHSAESLPDFEIEPIQLKRRVDENHLLPN